MKRAGVRVGFGTDLIGALQPMQSIECSLRSPVVSNFEILNQATGVNAEIIRAKGQIGEISAGAFADILIVDGNLIGQFAAGIDDEQALRLWQRAAAESEKLHGCRDSASYHAEAMNRFIDSLSAQA